MAKKFIPNIITLLNLGFGLTSLWFTMQGLHKEAAVSILLAMVLDGMDGRLARRFNVTSEFGKELDSLCDLVSFGVAPSLLLYGSVMYQLGYIGFFITLIFAFCGAIRLARFNVLNIKDYFVGVPITIAGPLLAILVLLVNSLPVGFYLVASLVLSYLMVSNFKIPKY